MFQPRMLARGEAILRDPATGGTNLAAAPDIWHELRPRHEGERFEILAVSLLLGGANLLSRLDALGDSAGTIEFGMFGFDGYGTLRDMAATSPQVLSSADEWNEGVHQNTFADAEAGRQRDQSLRTGLRAVPLRGIASPAPASGRWTSGVLEVRYGQSLAGLSWDCWTLRDPAGATIAPPTVELRMGNRSAAGLIAWDPYGTIASTGPEIDKGCATFAAPKAGNVFQLRVTLPYLPPGVAVTPADSARHSATFFSLCAWADLAHKRWRFTALSELLERAELVRHLAPAANAAGDDIAILRLPMTFTLRQSYRESMRARVGSGSGLSLLEIVPAADLRFEPKRG
jgi:hypothetical protein